MVKLAEFPRTTRHSLALLITCQAKDAGKKRSSVSQDLLESNPPQDHIK